MENNQIKNILFDLGGVILNLDLDRCIRSFTELGFRDFDQYISKTHPSGIFKQMETGQIDTKGFIDLLNRTFHMDVPNELILKAWNSFLMDVPMERRQLLAELKTRYNIFLLSNTSPPHAATFEKLFTLNDNFREMSDFFDKIYYSFNIGASKPHPDSFNHVLNDAEIKAEETLFIDDSQINTQASNLMGFNTITINDGFDILDIDFVNIQKNATFVPGNLSI